MRFPKGRLRLLVTGFGPFPGAPENPTSALVQWLASTPADEIGAPVLRAIVLPTDYRKSWDRLRRVYNSFHPDIVVHFGLSTRAKAITVERLGRNSCLAERPDAAGWWPRRVLGKAGAMASTLPAEKIVAALIGAGIPAELSDDAGGYVCNATLYRSLAVPQARERMVGFIHVPPQGSNGLMMEQLQQAATLILKTVIAAGADGEGRPLSVAACAGDLIGSAEGPGDLATNPAHMEKSGR